MRASRLVPVVLVIFGLFAGLMLVLVTGSERQRAARYAALAERGVEVVALDAGLRAVTGTGQRTRGIFYNFALDSGVVVEGTDGVPVAQVEALVAGGLPRVVFLPDAPEVNALAINVAAWAEAGGRNPRDEGWSRALVAGFAGLALVVALVLWWRRRSTAR
jgi:hypothetical protein